LNVRRFLLLLLPSLIAFAGCRTATPTLVPGYVNTLPPENAADREERIAEVQARRKNPVVLVHRGASDLAPENTLEAYAAAMDCGADGCEIDIRPTLDGVLVLYHDDDVFRLSDGIGNVNELTYSELLAMPLRRVYGTATEKTRPPTLAALLDLARRRRMLLHLDIKTPGIEEQIVQFLDEGDLWDHIVYINDYNSEKIRSDPRYHPLPWKSEIYTNRRDVNAEAISDLTPDPGQMVILDDPRLMARELGREPYRPVPIPDSLRREWPLRIPDETEAAEGAAAIFRRYKKECGNLDIDKILGLMKGIDPASYPFPPESEKAADERLHAILLRAWCASELGKRGDARPEIVAALIEIVRTRMLHEKWGYHGLDGAAAIKALATLHAKQSVPLLVERLFYASPDLKEDTPSEFKYSNPAVRDYRLKEETLRALGVLRTPEAKAALIRYVASSEEELKPTGFPIYNTATRSLLEHDLSKEELRSVLQSANPTVRGTAILIVLARGTPEEYQILTELHPWAAELPRGEARTARRE